MEEAIRAFVDKIKANLVGMALDEASTKATIVVPMLRRLGWDDEKVEQVRPEYPVEGGRVDYGLCLNGRCVFLIEVKKPSEELENHEEQLLRYSFQQGVELAALTNGSTWFFYLPLRAGQWSGRRFFAIDVLAQTSAEAAKHFCLILSKDNVANGTALKHAQEIHTRRSQKTAILEAMPKAWNKIILDAEPRLLGILLDTTERLCGHRPTDAEVAEFLSTHRRQFEILTPAPPIEPKRQSPTPNPELHPAGRLSTRDFDALLIETLKALGGKANKVDAEAEAFRRKQQVFKQAYWQEPVGEGIPRWKKSFQWARHRAVKRGLIEPPENVPHGVWGLTPKGVAPNAAI